MSKRKLTEDMIIEAAKAYYAEHGTWPTASSGTADWAGVNLALQKEGRALREARRDRVIANPAKNIANPAKNRDEDWN